MKRQRRKRRPLEQTQAKAEPFFNKIQRKIAIGKANDPFETEADAMADRVVAKSGSGGSAFKSSETEPNSSAILANQVTPLAQRSVEEESQAKLQRQEEEEAAQAKIQRQEEEEAAQPKLQRMEEEEPQAKLQRQEEEEAAQPKLQRMEEEEPQAKLQRQDEEEEAAQPKLQRMEEEEPQAKLQRQEEEEPQAKLQRQEEEEAQAKQASHSGSVSSGMEQTLKQRKGSGQKMDPKTQNEMESGFGSDFSHVNIHTDATARDMNQQVGAQAFTYGNDIYFNQGKYSPDNKKGKHLLAHELTHTIQQKGKVERKVQRKGKSWRYTLPKKVKRSVAEIQAIVGATPDGVYGPKTRARVIEYQKVLKASSFYSDTIDGKWGKNTDAGHLLFGYGPNAIRKGYNCAGFAFKSFKWVDLAPTKAIYAGMKKLPSMAATCDPFDFKFWMWEFNLKVHDTATGVTSSGHTDFHTVGGRTHKDGSDPKTVMSKNGGRPLEGPGSPMSFELKNGPAPDKDAKPSPRYNWIITPIAYNAYCSKKLP